MNLPYFKYFIICWQQVYAKYLPLKHPYTSPALPLVYRTIYRTHTQDHSNGFCIARVSRALVYRDPVTRVRFPAGSLGVAFFTTGPGWVISFSHSNVPYFIKISPYYIILLCVFSLIFSKFHIACGRFISHCVQKKQLDFILQECRSRQTEGEFSQCESICSGKL